VSQNFDGYAVSQTRIQKDRKDISKIFFCLTLALIIPYFFLMLVGFVVSWFPDFPRSLLLIINDSYTVFVAVLFSLFTRKITSRSPIALSDMKVSKFFLIVCASLPLMIAGALIGNVISTFFGNALDRDITNAIDTLAEDYPFGLVFVSVIIIAPVFEELMFRKLLIDKISRFGFSFSILVSGLVFGTFHGNFYQIFYGCFLGFLLAFVYCTYARVRYCIVLHSIINFIGFVCPLYIGEFLSSSNLILNFFAMCYSLLYYICILFGIIVIILGIKTFRAKNPSLLFLPEKESLRKNFGLLSYLIFTTIILVLSLFV